MLLQERIHKLYAAIGQDDLNGAFEILGDYLGNNNPQTYSRLLTLSSKYHRLKQDASTGLITYETTQTEITKIIHALLEFVTELGGMNENIPPHQGFSVLLERANALFLQLKWQEARSFYRNALLAHNADSPVAKAVVTQKILVCSQLLAKRQPTIHHMQALKGKTLRYQEGFWRLANDAILFLQLSIFEAFDGCAVDIQTVSGRQLKVKIQPQTQNGKLYRLKSEGFSCAATKQRGDFLIIVQVYIPNKLSPVEQQRLAEVGRFYGIDFRVSA